MKRSKDRRTDNEIYRDLQKLGRLGEAKAGNALNYLISIEEEEDFSRRLRRQERPSGVQ